MSHGKAQTGYDKIPGNSMADQPELVGGNQNDQAAQPSAANQNNQLVQLSADKNKNKNKREADKKYRDGKKKKTAGILEQNQTLIADKAKLKRKLASTKAKSKRKLASTKAKSKRKLASTKAKLKRKLASMKASLASTKASLASTKASLDQSKEDMEQTRESNRIEKLKVETQNSKINELQQQLQLPPQFNTGEIGLPVNHPPANQPATTMVSGVATNDELLGLLQLLLPQEGAHGYNVEQSAYIYGGDLPGSLDHSNNTCPPGTGIGYNVEQPAFNYGGYLSGSLDHLKNTYPPGTIVIKPGPEVDPVKGPGLGFHGSTRVNPGQPGLSGLIKKN
ncbi:uncharacterized protein [Populus alba]|uniref:uncharacterized protein n=1 Tax=Populus alba TaxID=43335 RepID=UPI003CC70C52